MMKADPRGRSVRPHEPAERGADIGDIDGIEPQRQQNCAFCPTVFIGTACLKYSLLVAAGALTQVFLTAGPPPWVRARRIRGWTHDFGCKWIASPAK
jgi:hypothetical protein